MIRWAEEYHRKRLEAEQAVTAISSGDRVFVSGNAAMPSALLQALAERSTDLQEVELIHVLLLGEDPFSLADTGDCFRHNSLFVGPADRKAVNAGRADYIPVHLHEIPQLFNSGLLPLDVALIHSAPPDEHGFMSLGVECLATMAAVANAPVILAQVNDQMPRTLGDCFVHVSRVTSLIETSQPLPELEATSISEVEQRIGEHVAELVEDGTTLQLGIGAIPDAVLSSLNDRKDLGIHSEMVSDGIMDAIEAGTVTGNRKTLHKGKVICTFALGSHGLYQYLEDNPRFEFHPTDYVNDPYVISQNDRMVAINSAIEADLTGQVCSDSIGTTIYSGFGGQVDFIRGASRSSGGKAIIAMPSTARNGTISRIVPCLKQGAGVVTTRADVHYLVTEFGAAQLHGKNLRERAQALIEIAHPDFQDELIESAQERKLLT